MEIHWRIVVLLYDNYYMFNKVNLIFSGLLSFPEELYNCSDSINYSASFPLNAGNTEFQLFMPIASINRLCFESVWSSRRNCIFRTVRKFRTLAELNRFRD